LQAPRGAVNTRSAGRGAASVAAISDAVNTLRSAALDTSTPISRASFRIANPRMLKSVFNKARHSSMPSSTIVTAPSSGASQLVL